MKKLFKILMAAAVLAAFPAVAMGMASFDYPVQHPVLSIVHGDVTVKPAALTDWGAAEEGMLLNTGDSVRTGAGARAEISCATGKMRLYENTIVVIPRVVDEEDRKDIRQVNLEEGTGLFRIKKRGVEKGFEVHTQQIIAGVKGTLFVVQTTGPDGVSRVAVYSGLVEVTDARRSPASRNLLGKGQTVEVNKDGQGTTDTMDFEPDRPWGKWQGSPVYEIFGAPWLQSVTPAPTKPGTPARLGAVGDQYDVYSESSEGGESCPPVVDNSGNVVVP